MSIMFFFFLIYMCIHIYLYLPAVTLVLLSLIFSNLHSFEAELSKVIHVLK